MFLELTDFLKLGFFSLLCLNRLRRLKLGPAPFIVAILLAERRNVFSLNYEVVDTSYFWTRRVWHHCIFGLGGSGNIVSLDCEGLATLYLWTMRDWQHCIFGV